MRVTHHINVTLNDKMLHLRQIKFKIKIMRMFRAMGFISCVIHNLVKRRKLGKEN
jgi:hypothetical protein